MTTKIESEQLYIKEIFKRWYRVPEYQRPYVWGKDQINDLLDDITFAQQNNDTEYFLGSIVLQKKIVDKHKEYDLLDGQQRLTTLFLIVAVIRDLTNNENVKRKSKEIIFREEDELDDDVPERVRIVFDIRQEVKDFINEYIKIVDKLNDIESLKTKLKKTKDLSVKNMINAIFEIRDYFIKNMTDVKEFLKYINNNMLLIHVSSTNLEDAFKLFTVMNNRGIKLRNSDILKAMNLKEVSGKDREEYAKKWEDIESYFEDDFDTFLSHLRTILVKEKARKNLLDEFEENIYSKNLLKKGKDTIDYIKKYKEHYDYISNQDHSNNGKDYRFDNLISIMTNTLPSDLWIAPLLRFYDKFQDKKLLEFLEKLDNKFSYDWIVGLTPTSRIENINSILKKIDDVSDVDTLLKDEVFDINCNDFMSIIGKDIYGKRFAKYILYKLDYLYGNTDKINVPKTISMEHILPQNPEGNSQWKKDFTDNEREKWTNKIGNLVLISRRKNSSQGRLDFEEKNKKYFEKNIDLFKNSLRVMKNYNQWKPTDIEKNQKEVLLEICNHYCNRDECKTIFK